MFNTIKSFITGTQLVDAVYEERIDIPIKIQEMKTRCSYLSYQIDTCIKVAKTHVKNGKKKEAITQMKRKNQFERSINNLQGQITNLEQQQMAIESATDAHEMVDLMKDSVKVLDEHMKTLDVDDVVDVRDDLQILTEETAEITNILAEPFSTNGEDDQDILLQMAQWDDEVSTSQTEKIVDSLPNVSNRKLVATNNNNNGNNNNGTMERL